MTAEYTDINKLFEDHPITGDFIPYCRFSNEADAVDFHFEEHADYSDRLNEHVTLYRCLDTNKVIGCRLKGVKKLSGFLGMIEGSVEGTSESIDYTEFFDIQTCGGIKQEQTKSDFVYRLSSFLTQSFSVPYDHANGIAHSLWASMTRNVLHYHTPVHVLGMLQTLDRLIEEDLVYDGIDSSFLRLAIWFHDAVYIVGSTKEMNERCSADFMTAMMKPYISDINDLSLVRSLIIATADFHNMNLSPVASFLMDLDILGFAWEQEHYIAANLTLDKEFLHVFDMENYLKGRKQFLSALNEREHIYRTPAIREKYEERARENLKFSLAKLEESS